MLPTPADVPPENRSWLHEIGFDGLRIVLLVERGSARAFTCHGEEGTERFPAIAAAASALQCRAAILDGELIVPDASGRPDRSALERALARAPERLVVMAYDLLHLNGRDLRQLPLEERRALLERLLARQRGAQPIQFSPHVEGGGAEFLDAAQRMGLRSIVSKKKGSRYRSGRSDDWLVIRTQAAPEGLKVIPGSAKAGGEPSYKKPKLPDKGAVVDYYRRMAPLLLAHAQGRPLNLFRCTAGYCFYQRNRNHPASGGVFGAPIRFFPIEQKNGRTEDYLYVEDEAGIVACAEADGIEFHGWGSLVADVERPDRIAFDLDPGEGTGFAEVKEAAVTMRNVLSELELESFAMLSGGKGIHVVVPIEPDGDWAAVRGFARQVCTALAEAEPERFTVSLPKAERKARIFLDYLRNQRTATAVLPWSLRARAGAPVAAPVAWEELPSLARASAFTIDDVDLLLRRAQALKGWGEGAQPLPRLR